jgi:hypothetical protein
MSGVGWALDCPASSARNRRVVTSPWGRSKSRPDLRLQPETIDLKPIGYLNPARRPIAQTGQPGLSRIAKMQFVTAGPIRSRISTDVTDEIKREKGYISGQRSGNIRVALNVLSRRAMDQWHPQRFWHVYMIAENSLSPFYGKSRIVNQESRDAVAPTNIQVWSPITS